MPRPLAALFLTLLVLTACACSQTSAPRLPVRALSSEAPHLRLSAAGRETPEHAATRDDSAPRIGAPGGSGAGSRRVQPAQSGNETVGGLPAGTGGSAGPRG